MWFEHPTRDVFSHPWQSHVIAEGPDTFFTLTSLPTPDGDVDCIITAGFFSQSLNIYWTTDPQGRWDDPATVSMKHTWLMSGKVKVLSPVREGWGREEGREGG